MAGDVLQELKVLLGADISDYEKKMSAVTKAQRKLGADMEELGKELSLKLTAPILAAAAAFVTLAAEEEAADFRLAASLRNVGVSFQDVESQMRSTIGRMEGMTAFNDTKLQDSLTTLVNITRDYEDSLRALPVAADLARATGMDLESAAQLVGRAYNGNVTALKRYGIELDATARGTEALAALQARFAGSAEAYGRSFEGAFLRLKNEASNAAEALGKALLPFALKAVEALTVLAQVGIKLGTAFGSLPVPVQAAIIGFVGLLAAIGPVLLVVGKLVLAWAPLKALLIAGASVAGPFIAAMAVLAAKVLLVAATFTFFYANGRKVIDGLSGVFLAFVGTVLDGIYKILNGFTTLIMKIPGWSQAMKSWMTEDVAQWKIWADAANMGAQEFATAFENRGGWMENTKAQMGTWVEDIKAMLVSLNLAAANTNLGPPVPTAALTFYQKWAAQMKATAQSMSEGITASMAQMAASMVSSLAQGTFDAGRMLLMFAVKTLEVIIEWAVAGALAASGLSQALAVAFANPWIAAAAIAGLIGVVAGLSAAFQSKASGVALASGGMSQGITQATIGDNPSGEEVVLPLDSTKTTRALSAAMPSGGVGEQTIIVKMGDEEVARSAVRGMPSIINLAVGD